MDICYLMVSPVLKKLIVKAVTTVLFISWLVVWDFFKPLCVTVNNFVDITPVRRRLQF